MRSFLLMIAAVLMGTHTPPLHAAGGVAPGAHLRTHVEPGIVVKTQVLTASAENVLDQCAGRGPAHIPECSLLRQRLCNRPALEAVTRVLFRRNDYFAMSLLGTAFLERCDNDERIGMFTAQAYYHLTDFERSLETLDRFPQQVGTSAQFASWRGFALEKLNRFEEAANEFQRTLYLFPELSNVGAMQFYYTTRTLRQLGRYCDAIAPLQQFVGFDPATRLTTQIEQEIRTLRSLGNCSTDEVSGTQNVRLGRQDGLLIINASVNGVAGQFILDTGASSVHLTRDFAERANIELRETQRITVHGVTGSRLDYFGIVPSVAVEGVHARNVPVTIASEAGSLFDAVDGLLGQTFLGRFQYSIHADQLTLKPL